MLLFLICPPPRTPHLLLPKPLANELMREVATQKSSTHGWAVMFTLIIMKICPLAQWAQVTMATYQEHHSHKLEQRSKDRLHPDTEAVTQ